MPWRIRTTREEDEREPVEKADPYTKIQVVWLGAALSEPDQGSP